MPFPTINFVAQHSLCLHSRKEVTGLGSEVTYPVLFLLITLDSCKFVYKNINVGMAQEQYVITQLLYILGASELSLQSIEILRYFI